MAGMRTCVCMHACADAYAVGIADLRCSRRVDTCPGPRECGDGRPPFAKGRIGMPVDADRRTGPHVRWEGLGDVMEESVVHARLVLDGVLLLYGEGWRVEGGGWRVKSGGWRVEGEG